MVRKEKNVIFFGFSTRLRYLCGAKTNMSMTVADMHIQTIIFQEGQWTCPTIAGTGDVLVPLLPRNTKTTEYIGGDIEAESQSLIYGSAYKYHFGNGYVRFYPGSTQVPQYFFYTKDHLGNVRSVVTKNHSTNEITEVQQTAYYPFGGIIADLSTGRNVQNHLYNGKELDYSNNLYWYDYGARQYDSTAPRFTTPDPLAEKYYPWNYYAYCMNNPVNAIDPDGRIVRYIDSEGVPYIYYEGNFYRNTRFNNGKFEGDKVTNMDNNMRNVLNALIEMSKVSNSDVQEVYNTLTNVHDIKHIHDIKVSTFEASHTSPNGNKTTTYLNYDASKNGSDFKDCGLTFFQLVAHELKHAYDAQVGIATRDEKVAGINVDEFSTVYFENLVRPAQKQRKTYGGVSIFNSKIPIGYRMVIMKNKGGKKYNSPK